MNEATPTSTSSEIDSLFERTIIDIGIPPCPEILRSFMVESAKDEPDYHRLAGIIGADVALAASLIKTANSPYFGVRQRVRSVNDALVVLGIKTSTSAVACVILRNTFPSIPHMVRFWDNSARIARLSGWLVQYFSIHGILPEDAYTFGLFRDCGIPVLLRRFQNYFEVLEASNRETVRSFVEVEETQMPTNHAMVGGILAQSWWLPEELCLAIRNHHDLAQLESATAGLPVLSRKLIATAQLAEHIVQRQLSLSLTEEWNKLGAACLRQLDIGADQLDAMYLAAVPIAIATE
jgi:HD-like signal output (HDOD) protein